MPHEQPKRLRRVGIVALPDHLIKHPAVHMIPQRHPNGVVIRNAEMIAGNNLATFHSRKVFNATNLFYDQLSVINHFIKEASSKDIGDLVFDLVGKLFVQVVDLIRHKGISLRVILHILMPQFFAFKICNASEEF